VNIHSRPYRREVATKLATSIGGGGTFWGKKERGDGGKPGKNTGVLFVGKRCRHCLHLGAQLMWPNRSPGWFGVDGPGQGTGGKR